MADLEERVQCCGGAAAVRVRVSGREREGTKGDEGSAQEALGDYRWERPPEKDGVRLCTRSQEESDVGQATSVESRTRSCRSSDIG